jgi:DNA end-binding protein Ku
MEVRKGGDKAYTLLRQALAESGKIAIAKVVIKTRQHLAAIKPQQRGLMLEIMHFPEELLDASDFKQPAASPASKGEIAMAKKLIESMSVTWDASIFKDDYHEMLEKVIEAKIKNKGQKAPAVEKKPKVTNVIDLAAVLQESIKNARTKKVPSSQPRKNAA